LNSLINEDAPQRPFRMQSVEQARLI